MKTPTNNPLAMGLDDMLPSGRRLKVKAPAKVPSERTAILTPEEMAGLDTIPRFGNPIQDATIELRKRSGLRYGSCVGKGLYSVVLTAHSLDKKGHPTGYADVKYIKQGLTADELVKALKAL